MNKKAKAPYKRLAITVALALGAVVSLAATAATAQDIRNYTRANLDAWMREYANAKPRFKPGDVLSEKDLDKIRPFVPPGNLEQLNFPGFKMRIIGTRDHSQRGDFLDCTEKYQPQVKLNRDGTLANYLCGQPFADAALEPGDSQSGLKAAYNFDYRWQNFGEVSLNFLFVYDRFGGNHVGQAPTLIEAPPQDWMNGVSYQSKLPTNVSRMYGGGGTFERTISAFYERLYFSHLAPMAARGGLLDTPDAKDFFWKEFTGFFSPYDVRGQVVINYRYSDPQRADDAWAYDPKSRRVRRISVEAKADSVAGSEQTVDDFYTFSGRALSWNWRFLGWRWLLSVLDAKDDYGHFYGPNGDISDDVWSLRRFAVVERTPKAPNHPYSSVVMMWDAQNWVPWLAFAFTRDSKLYKTFVMQHRWSEDFRSFAEFNRGVRCSTLQCEIVVDVQHSRATIFAGYGTGNPNLTPERVRIFDINQLEEAHR